MKQTESRAATEFVTTLSGRNLRGEGRGRGLAGCPVQAGAPSAGWRAAARCGYLPQRRSAGPRCWPASPAATTTSPVTRPAASVSLGRAGGSAARPGRGGAGAPRLRSPAGHRDAPRGCGGRAAPSPGAQSAPGGPPTPPGPARAFPEPGATAAAARRHTDGQRIDPRGATAGTARARSRPAGMGPHPAPRPRRRSPPPARQENHLRRFSSSDSGPAVAGGQAGRRCLS